MARMLYVSQGYCTHDRRFVERISRAGHEICYLPCEAAAVQVDLPRSDEIHWLRPLSNRKVWPGKPGWIVSAMHFRDAVRQVAPELIHAGPVQTGGFFAATMGFHPLLMMSWGSDVLFVPEKSAWLRRITQFALRHADMAIADCEAASAKIAEFSGLDVNCIVTLPWGIDLQQFRPKISTLQLRSRLGWEQCRVIVSSRSFEPIYGTMTFLRAIEQVLRRASDVRVLMLGDGSLRGTAEQFIQKHGLMERVYLAGQIPEEMIPDYFAEADLYVSATRCDGSSISLLQAMGCGLPVIVADACGNREWVSHGENGWLYRAGNATELAETILHVISDDAGCAVARCVNLEIVKTRADWNRNFNRVLEAYERLLTSKSARRMRHAQLHNW